MEILLIALLIPLGIFLMGMFLVIIFAVLPLYYQFRKSAYQKETGTAFRTLMNDRGALGKFLIFLELEKYPEPKKIMANLYLEKGEGTTEIDLMMISPAGLHVFESKNYSGKIYGNDQNKNWTQYLGGKKFNFFNPVWQNAAHIKALQNTLGLENQDFIQSFIVFGNRSELRKITVSAPHTSILKTRNLLPALAEEYKEKKAVLSNEEMDAIFQILKKYRLADENEKQQHIEYVQQKVK